VDDPYLIYTAEQMNAIGADPNDWDKHFLLMADIDLSAYVYDSFNLIGTRESAATTRPRRSLVRSVADTPEGPFRGVFDGNGHTIANFQYGGGAGEKTIGLFMYVNDPNAVIKNLGLIAPDIHTWDRQGVGSLVGSLISGTVTDCYAHGGTVTGLPYGSQVGGLIGYCDQDGDRGPSRVIGCYADVTVMGRSRIGGLVGFSDGEITNCYAMGEVIGDDQVGGLAGEGRSITNCYAVGAVIGEQEVGGLVGGVPAEVVASFWDVQASRQATSVGGEGKTTAQMQALLTYRAWGERDSAGVWTIDEGKDYPRLTWENRPGVVIEAVELDDLLVGTGTAEDPYLIHTTDELALVASEPDEWGRHFRLMADLDLGTHPDVGLTLGWGEPNSRAFTGVFDGNGHTISNFTYVSQWGDCGGFFGYVTSAPCGGRGEPDCDAVPHATIKDLGLVNPVVDGIQSYYAGGLVGILGGGTVSNCYVEGGLVMGTIEAGGLVGDNRGTVRGCYVVGTTIMLASMSGGLVGGNGGHVINCYSTGRAVRGDGGGLIGTDRRGDVTASFWDMETSGLTISAGGTGLTTVEMMGAGVFLDAGWDFVGEVENGVEDVWWILEGEGYPRLWWELGDEAAP